MRMIYSHVSNSVFLTLLINFNGQWEGHVDGVRGELMASHATFFYYDVLLIFLYKNCKSFYFEKNEVDQ